VVEVPAWAGTPLCYTPRRSSQSRRPTSSGRQTRAETEITRRAAVSGAVPDGP
jgi:hypothetical protein